MYVYIYIYIYIKRERYPKALGEGAVGAPGVRRPLSGMQSDWEARLPRAGKTISLASNASTATCHKNIVKYMVIYIIQKPCKLDDVGHWTSKNLEKSKLSKLARAAPLALGGSAQPRARESKIIKMCCFVFKKIYNHQKQPKRVKIPNSRRGNGVGRAAVRASRPRSSRRIGTGLTS